MSAGPLGSHGAGVETTVHFEPFHRSATVAPPVKLELCA